MRWPGDDVCGPIRKQRLICGGQDPGRFKWIGRGNHNSEGATLRDKSFSEELSIFSLWIWTEALAACKIKFPRDFPFSRSAAYSTSDIGRKTQEWNKQKGHERNTGVPEGGLMSQCKPKSWNVPVSSCINRYKSWQCLLSNKIMKIM